MRFIARFAQEKEAFFEVITVYDERIVKERLNKRNPLLISIAKDYPAAVWFERKIKDDFGIGLLYANDERPLVKHQHFPKDIFAMRKAFTQKSITYELVDNSLDSANQGVTIGPIHPYHLEASKFQLFERDESVLDFELISFYKHRGVEKMVEGMMIQEAKPILERISASQSIAYQTALLDIERQATKKSLPEVIQKRNTFLLELERIVNHLSDLSILCQLVDFHDGATFFSRHTELARGVLKSLTGNRFGFNSIGGEVEFFEMEQAYEFLFLLEKELFAFEKWIAKREDILEEMLLLGQLNQEKVMDYGLVGIMARSVGIRLDRRDREPFFLKHDYYMSEEEAGDTFSRFNIRVSEIFTSIRIMRNLVHKSAPPFFLGVPIDGEYYAYVESSAGELMLYIALKDGRIERLFVRDPSFLNAQVLPFYLENSKVSQLSLIIKSIPLNVSAIDL